MLFARTVVSTAALLSKRHHQPPLAAVVRTRAFSPVTAVQRRRGGPCLGSSLYSSSVSSSSDGHSSQDVVQPQPAAAIVPRAAVSVVVRSDTRTGGARYALVQRGKKPNKGMWSFPGGKIEGGERTLDAARRELNEETGLGSTDDDGRLLWYAGGAFTCSDSIHVHDHPDVEDGNGRSRVEFHYVISQCFAVASSSSSQHLSSGGARAGRDDELFEDVGAHPRLVAADDAMDARWWTMAEIEEGVERGEVTRGVVRVIQRAESLYGMGLLPCE